MALEKEFYTRHEVRGIIDSVTNQHLFALEKVAERDPNIPVSKIVQVLRQAIDANEREGA